MAAEEVEMRRASLGRDEVHVWYALTDEVRDPARLAACLALLSPAERARHARLVYDKDRHTFLVAHALVRSTLSRYADVVPDRWTFRENAHGRPEIEAPAGAPPLRFNLSHTPGLVACAVTIERDIGVDVEHVDRRPVSDDLPARYFSALEVAALERLAEADRREAFFDYWTLKESYIKARGLGLAIPLDRFSFHLAPGRPPAISFAPDLADDPAAWQFATYRPAPRHKMAVAVRRPPGRDLPITLRQAAPLAES